jgi:uncharacterized protein (DUF983 family)
MDEFFQATRILLDGLLLRCPRCEMGGMFRSGFKMFHACPVCGLEFERASGEVTGGMGINTVATCIVELALAIAFVAGPPLPLNVQIALLIVVGVIFPIVFYRPSRGLWASFLFLTGNNSESD